MRADVTVTFGTYKPGLLIDPAREYAGAVRLVDIGLELPALGPEWRPSSTPTWRGCCPCRPRESDKYRRGVVGIVAGSARYPGAAVLAVAGALRGGAGAVRYAGPRGRGRDRPLPGDAGHPGRRKAGRVQAWVVGPGLGDGARRDGRGRAGRRTCRCWSTRTGCGGLDARACCGPGAAPTLLTPHAGEAAALLGVSRE